MCGAAYVVPSLARQEKEDSPGDFFVDEKGKQVHLSEAGQEHAEELLRRALGNLLDNALAFSPPDGSVELVVEQADGQVRFIVRDRGPGIPDYAHERVFERFYSLPRPDSGQRSSGLGLPFVREVMRLHGGEASLRNRPEGGAEAVLSLPAV